MTALVALLLAGQVSQASQVEVASTAPAAPHRFFVSSPYLSFTNWIGEDVGMYELHAGWRLTDRDRVGVKAVTWKLNKPLGIPAWDPALFEKTEYYPGRVREYGVGAFYQRMLWKGLFAAAELVPLRKIFLDPQGKEVGTGFRLYASVHVGYHLSFLRDRLFVEPQVHCNGWPVDSKGPEGFRRMDARWNSYFLFEPNLYLGVNL